MKVITYINAHKILVPPVVVALMWFFNDGSTDAFIYLSLHGTYSLLWLMKSALYPDRRFEAIVPLKIGLPFIFLPLAGYYLAPYLLISRRVTLAPWVIGACLSIYTIGIFFTMLRTHKSFSHFGLNPV
jgi:hypothetical protein